jgi:hypothetical protein
MHDEGIAWMIAGGVRAESAEDRRQRQHRLALAQTTGRRDTMLRLRERIAGVVGGRSRAATGTGALSGDCCPA